MRLLKRLTVISLLMLPCCYASAQSANGESIVISENATELGKVDLSEVNRISFTEEALSVDKKDGTNERYSYKATVSFIDNRTDARKTRFDRRPYFLNLKEASPTLST